MTYWKPVFPENWMSYPLGDMPAKPTAGVDLEYTLRVYLSRFSDGWFELDYDGKTFHADGPNLDADYGFFSPGLCDYTNALASGVFEVRYSTVICEVQS